MPIITTQRRMAEQGRIRLGHKVSGTSKAGKAYTRPDKLDRFRFTSPSQRLIEQIAETYGGTAKAWDNAGKAEFEVISDATAIPVIVVKGGFSQWHEHWTKAGCQHRCDGEKDAAGNYCDPDDEFHRLAIEKPTTRLSVMLSEIESLGVWRMETKGWNAAAELPSMAELAMHVGDLVPATLGLAERSAIIQTHNGPQTSRFVVPYLDLHVTKQRLVEIVGGPGGTATAIGGLDSGPAAIEAAKGERPNYEGAADNALDLDTLRDLWGQAAEAGHLDDGLRAYLTARVEAVKAAASESAPAEPVVDDDGAVEAELVEEPSAPATAGGVELDADAVWAEIVKAAGVRGMSLPEVEDDVRTFFGGMSSAEASGAELAEYLTDLQGRAA